MKYEEYRRYDGLGLAELINSKEVSPREVVDAAIARAHQVNPKVNALTFETFDIARQEAEKDLPPGPFKGVPFLIKDLGLHVKGMPLSQGSGACKGKYHPDFDDHLIQRYRQAGLVFCGRTSTPEFGLMGFTEPDAFGATRNPWNLNHTPGGSSGGAGAAVAAGIVPIASASDGGGSIRIPAAACGLFGLKPSRGRTPLGPSRGEGWDGAAVCHVVTRTVRDSAAILDATSGYAPGGPYSIAPPETTFLKALSAAPRPLKIGYTTRSPIDTPVDKEVKQALESTVELLREMGHTLIRQEPDIDGMELARAYLTMYFGHVAADVRWIRKEFGDNAVEDLEDTSRLLALIGEALPAGEFVERKRRWNYFSHQMATFHETYDLYLTPTKAALPAKIGELKPDRAKEILIKGFLKLGSAKLLIAIGLVEKMAKENLARTPFTQLANLTGQPAMSIPLGRSSSGLPIGIQFVAPFGDEATLFSLAARLEEARQWADLEPAL